MILHVNGAHYQADPGLTIGQLLDRLNLRPERVVLELNQNILNATENLTAELHEGDRLEIIQFVGGG